MSSTIILSDNRKFLTKFQKIQKGSCEDFERYCSTLDLEEKKKCCVIGNGRRLETLNDQYLFQVTSSETVIKRQWFHSAAAIYVLLTHPQLIEKDSWANSLMSTRNTFIKVARDVLNSDLDGIEYVKIMDSQKLTLNIASNTIVYKKN